MSESLEDRIIRHEGFCAVPKIDISPMYVIGYGHDITENEAKTTYADGISNADALALLESDIANCKLQVAKHMPWTLGMDDTRLEVLVEMVFQLGIAGVLKFTHTLSDIRSKNWVAASNGMLASKWHQETPARCEELADIMLNGS